MNSIINNVFLKFKDNEKFIKFVIFSSFIFPYFLFYLLEYDININVERNHFLFIISFYILQMNLMKIIPSDSVYTEYHENYVNKYIYIKNNGKYCALLTFIFFSLGYFFEFMSKTFIINNFKELIIIKLFLCLIYSTYIYLKNNSIKTIKWNNFFYGNETFPVLLNTNLKVLNYYRFGMTLWLIYIYSFMMAQYEINGYVTYSLLTSTFLQFAYICKYFLLEEEYNSSHMIMNKSGWLTTYACFLYIPMVNTLASHYFSINAYDVYPLYFYIIIFILGMYFIYLNYKLEMDKKIFKESKGQYIYKNQKAIYISSGNQRLLMSGLWGKIRKPNYLTQILISFFICCMHGTDSIIPYLYFIFLVFLGIFKIYVEEYRYLNKFPNLYKRYIDLVKYKIIPYIY